MYLLHSQNFRLTPHLRNNIKSKYEFKWAIWGRLQEKEEKNHQISPNESSTKNPFHSKDKGNIRSLHVIHNVLRIISTLTMLRFDAIIPQNLANFMNCAQSQHNLGVTIVKAYIIQQSQQKSDSS